MRVLHLYSGNLYGGIETFLATLARLRHLCPEMEPEFGLCFRGRIWNELVDAGVTVYDLGAVKLSRPWTVLAARMRLQNIMRERKFDVVMCHSVWPHAIFGPVAKKAKVKLVTFIHDSFTKPKALDRIAAWTKPDLLLSNSRFTGSTIASVFPETNVTVVYLPISSNDYRTEDDSQSVRSRIRKSIDANIEMCVILQASRLEPYKGAQKLIDALILLKDLPNWQAWIVGGPQKSGEQKFLNELKETATSGGISDRVHFLGQRNDVRDLMLAADLYCQANTAPEPFGIAFVEALYSKLPVVTVNHGGGAEIVDGTCGVLVPPGDDFELSVQLRELICDRGLRSSLAQGGANRATLLCDPKVQLKKISDALKQAV